MEVELVLLLGATPRLLCYTLSPLWPLLTGRPRGGPLHRHRVLGEKPPEFGLPGDDVPRDSWGTQPGPSA